jgi:hypothetical protein
VGSDMIRVSVEMVGIFSEKWGQLRKVG